MAINFKPLGQTSRLWSGLGASPTTGDIYAADDGGVSGDYIYKQAGGVGNFVLVSPVPIVAQWWGIGVAPIGSAISDIYAFDGNSINTRGIYKQTGGIGAFVLVIGNANWRGCCIAPNGDVYGSISSEIYMQTGGVGAFNALGAGSLNFGPMCAAPNGDVYANSTNGPRKRTGGVGSFVLQSTEVGGSWQGISAAINGDIYTCMASSGVILKQAGGTGIFSVIGTLSKDTRGLCCAPNGSIYVSVRNGDIYKYDPSDTWLKRQYWYMNPYNL
jgi:hypothetical protein